MVGGGAGRRFNVKPCGMAMHMRLGKAECEARGDATFSHVRLISWLAVARLLKPPAKLKRSSTSAWTYAYVRLYPFVRALIHQVKEKESNMCKDVKNSLSLNSLYTHIYIYIYIFIFIYLHTISLIEYIYLNLLEVRPGAFCTSGLLPASGAMVLWYPSTPVPSYHRTMVPQYHGTLVPWYHSKMVLSYLRQATLSILSSV